MATDDDLPFKLEQWDRDGRIERVIARAANIIVGRGAYAAACRQYPKARLTLRLRCSIKPDCCCSDFVATNRIDGRVTASQIAAASLASFLLRFK